LAELGMGTVPQRLATDLCRAGATDAGDGRIRFPEAMVLKIIDQACKRFTLHGRDPARDIEVGGDRVYFGTGGAAVNTLDLDSGLYRPSTLADLTRPTLCCATRPSRSQQRLQLQTTSPQLSKCATSLRAGQAHLPSGLF